MELAVNILIGLLCIILGLLIIILYSIKKKETKRSLIFIKFQTAGLILIMIGVGLIIREIRK
jgi:hypothetical protein